jgi:hypothetical protein
MCYYQTSHDHRITQDMKVRSLAVADLATYQHDGQRATQPESFQGESATTSGRVRLSLRVFLDRMATMFARECAYKGKCVTATVLVRTSKGPVIYVAKNEGCDEKDKGLAKALVEWLQQIAGAQPRLRRSTKSGKESSNTTSQSSTIT